MRANSGNGPCSTLSSPLPLLGQIRYNALGQTTGWTWGNGAAYTRQYDADGRPQSYPLGAGTRALAYDAAGQIAGYQSTSSQALQAAGAVNQSQSFSYDIAGRLLGAANPGWQLSYGLDANGNRTGQSATDLAAATTTATQYHYILGSNRLDSAASAAATTLYQFDPAGHLTDDGKHRYSYNDAGRLVQADKSQYRHNGLGQRVAKTVPGQGTTLFVYDSQSQLIGEYDAAGRPIQETVYLGHTPVAVLVNGTVYRIHTDHLGAPRVIQDPAGKIVWTWDSDPYGNAWDQTAPTAAHGPLTYNLRLPGQYYDRETGLHYNGFRDYDPGTGRYVESDPIGLKGGLNIYAYVGNNPLNFVDPLGLEPYKEYPSVQDAGEQAVRDINPTSIKEGVEYAGRLCTYPNGSCFYTPPNKGGKDWPYDGLCPADTKAAGNYHTHGSYDKRYDNENFSEDDKRNLDKDNLPGLLGTPQGLIKIYTPLPNSPLNGSVQTIGSGAK